ncbi:nucleotidyltransferase family protein [Methylobacterium sp. ID0610]|uniref:nucleotidyltransferase family protein n=1 Tax=Methylobacterium carpenticola TaxID=3344827 RepID=UPI0036B3DA43
MSSLSLFGSVVRDEAGEGSDVDLFGDPDSDRFGFVELIRLEEWLTQELGCAVDPTTREGSHPDPRPVIEREAIRILR